MVRALSRLRGEEAPRPVGDGLTVAGRYIRCASAVAERRREDRSNSAAGKSFQANRRSPEFRGLPPSPTCAPYNRRAALDSHRVLLLGGLSSSRPDPDHIFGGPNTDRLDSELP